MRKYCFLFFAILWALNIHAQESSLDQSGSSDGDTVRQNKPRYLEVYHDNIGCPDYKIFAEYKGVAFVFCLRVHKKCL